MKIKPSTAFGRQIQEHYKEFALLKIPLQSNLEVPLGILNPLFGLKRDSPYLFNNLGEYKLPQTMDAKKKSEVKWQRLNVRKIFFSDNGQFCVLISDTEVVIIKICFDSFQTLARFRLPSTDNERVPSPPDTKSSASKRSPRKIPENQ